MKKIGAILLFLSIIKFYFIKFIIINFKIPYQKVYYILYFLYQKDYCTVFDIVRHFDKNISCCFLDE